MLGFTLHRMKLLQYEVGGNIPFSTTTRQLRAFSSGDSNAGGLQARGNPCLVTLVAEEPVAVPPAAAISQCVSWPLGARRAAVRCWTPGGRAIQCCGHGLLSCAAVWAERWDADGDGTLVMNGSEVVSRINGSQVWLGFEPSQPLACDIPGWTRNYFSEPPVAAAQAGQSSDYLVLEWPADFALGSLPVPDDSLAAHTDRALIVTCAISAGMAAGNESIRCRYFAPQHGVSEDPATGSAMRVLASYWQQRGLGHELTAFQCSAGGGLLFSRVEGGKTWIGGRASDMETEDAAGE